MKIPKEIVLDWAGANAPEFLLEVVTALVNGKYGIQDVQDNIAAHLLGEYLVDDNKGESK